MTSDKEWPSFADPFLAAVMDHVRVRSKYLWQRGRFFVEGDSGAGVAESFVVMLELRSRRSVVMQCYPRSSTTLVIRAIGRADNGRALYSSGRLQVTGSASDLLHAYEEVVSIVLRSTEQVELAKLVDGVWRRVCGPR